MLSNRQRRPQAREAPRNFPPERESWLYVAVDSEARAKLQSMEEAGNKKGCKKSQKAALSGLCGVGSPLVLQAQAHACVDEVRLSGSLWRCYRNLLMQRPLIEARPLVDSSA